MVLIVPLDFLSCHDPGWCVQDLSGSASFTKFSSCTFVFMQTKATPAPLFQISNSSVHLHKFEFIRRGLLETSFASFFNTRYSKSFHFEVF